MKTISRLFRKFLTLIQYLLVVIFILFEELVWEGIAEPIYGYLRSLKLLRRLELLVGRLNRYVLLILFVALFVAVEMAGIAAGVLLVNGMVFYGMALYALKIPIAAFVFWLFRVSREKLLDFRWFRWSYEKILALLSWLKALPVYRDTLEKIHLLKVQLKILSKKLRGFFGQRRSAFIRRFTRLYHRVRNAMKKR
ncbi:hypothetical protein [Nitratifractor sp.]